ncbi:MAG TPA: hypothetical protein VMM18_09440 [Gemmatimonadaceae bacterium]|nr:hypothetical protein [Gemmatimonadaceae bacterium]
MRRPATHGAGSLLALAAMLLLSGAASLGAQLSAAPVHRVEGRVLRASSTGGDPRPVAGVQVTLHRIGSDSAGALDSLRTAGDGRYAFRYRPFGSSPAIYLVSAEHGGVAYFAPPLREPVVAGDDADILVFDTTSAAVPISVRTRHLIVGAPFDGDREIIEVYELSNDTLLTAIPGEAGRAVWAAVVPGEAHDFTVPGDQGVAQTAILHRDGRVLLFAPFTPGVRQLAFTYRVPASAFPVRLPLERATGMLEVMVEEATGTVHAPGIAPADSTVVDGRSFRRFVARDLPSSGVMTLDLAPPPTSTRSLQIALTMTIVGAVMLLALARAFSCRGAGEAGLARTRPRP